MARSPEQIKQSMGQTVRTSDPSADLAKGPIFDLLLAPAAPEIAAMEQKMEDLTVLTSLQLAKVVTADQINAIGTTFSLPPLTGISARYRQTFFTSTRPTTDLPIERGTLVGTTDASRVYAVIERTVMLAANAQSYYNAQRKRYEITAVVEATAIGTSGNLPAFRIKRFLTKINGFDGTENRETALIEGTDRQSFAAYLTRIQRKLAGLNPEAGGGIASRILEYAPETISDIGLVYPKDRDVFRRDTGRPAIDAYIIGQKLDQTTQRYTAVGGETSVTLSLGPVVDITDVLVDSTSITNFTLSPDTNPSVSGTARAKDALVLGTPLSAGQVVDVSYTYDSLIYGLQTTVFDVRGSEFGTDILIRQPIELPITVQLDVTILSSFDVNRTTDSVRTIVFSYVESNRFITTLLPETLRQTILNNVAGVSAVNIQRFTPTTSGALPVEAVVVRKNEVPIVDQTNLLVSTHQ